MFFLKKRALLRQALGVRYVDPAGSVWRLRDERLVPVAGPVRSAIDECGKGRPVDGVEIVKQESNRLVYRARAPADPDRSYIVKVFPLRVLRHRLKYHVMKYTHNRFAFGEAVGLILASNAGLPVPEVYGYGCFHGRSGIITSSALILEDLSRHRSVRELLDLHRGDEARCAEIIKRAIPIFLDVYRAGVNLISLNIGAIMLGNDRARDGDYILDFEYARFYGRPSLELLMFEAATFCKYSRNYISEATTLAWLETLLDRLEIRDPSVRSRLTGRFNHYRGTTLSRKEREKIGAS